MALMLPIGGPAGWDAYNPVSSAVGEYLVDFEGMGPEDTVVGFTGLLPGKTAAYRWRGLIHKSQKLTVPIYEWAGWVDAA